MTRIAAVVFDYGNVLSLRPKPSDFCRLHSFTELDEGTALVVEDIALWTRMTADNDSILP